MKTTAEIKYTLKQCATLVDEFHEAFGVEKFKSPFDAPLPTRQLRARLHAEEFAEWIEAKVPVETLDAICDLAYVHAGTLMQLSVTDQPLLLKSMQHSVPRGVAMLRRPSFCEHTGERTLVEAAASVVNYGLSVLRPGLFEAAFAEVHRSNMAKLWTAAQVAELDGRKDRSALELQWTTRPVKDGLFSVKDGGGKIMKPPTWTPPNLQQFI
jgi:predicted HAD superfamily Cof-like phosphohydrolase